ncbi:MAG TPA: hypothetical protein VJ692_07225 [Nitrospiraceae bacterium]|nr:hypothetical protein [Nitrospiraceae bacterium]
MSLEAFAQAASGLDLRKTIPFDYRFLFDFSDANQRYVDTLVSETVTVSIEAAFTAVSIGYAVLAPESGTLRFGPEKLQDLDDLPPSPPGLLAIPIPINLAGSFLLSSRPIAGAFPAGKKSDDPVDKVAPRRILLGDVIKALSRKLDESARGSIGPRTAAALSNGIRINPELAKKIFIDGGGKPLESDDLAELFETVAAPPEQVQFLYALFDEGTGRAFQSEPILNIAGLGIADGDRPFRSFVPPITFLPRTSIKLDIIPKSEFRGELHVVLHGYKTLGSPGTPTSTRRGRR